jgi:hypothetical protein
MASERERDVRCRYWDFRVEKHESGGKIGGIGLGGRYWVMNHVRDN